MEAHCMTKETDSVDGPSHYLVNPDGSRRKFEPADVIDDWNLSNDHYLANAIEYICRSQQKQNFLQDLNKAIWNLRRRVALEQDRINEFADRPTDMASGIDRDADNEETTQKELDAMAAYERMLLEQIAKAREEKEDREGAQDITLKQWIE